MGGGKAGKEGKGQNAPFEDPTTEQRYQRLLDQRHREGKTSDFPGEVLPPTDTHRRPARPPHQRPQPSQVWWTHHRLTQSLKQGTLLHLRQPEGRGLTTSRLKGHRLRRTHLPQMPDLSYTLRCPRLARPRHSRLRSPHLKLALRSHLCQQRLLQLRLRSPHLATKLRLTWSSNTPYWACPVELFCSSGFWAGGVGDAQDARRTRGAKVFPRSSHLSVFSLDITPIYLSMYFQYTSALCMLSPSFVGWAAVSAQFCFVAG